MKHFSPIFSRGFTLIELLIVFIILGIIGTIVLDPLAHSRDQQALASSVETVLSVLSEARTKTLASEGDTRYGMYIETTGITLFEGAVYSSGASSNTAYRFSGTTYISTTSLASGTSTILFKRLSGETDNYGTITLGNNQGTITRQVTINKTGFASSE